MKHDRLLSSPLSCAIHEENLWKGRAEASSQKRYANTFPSQKGRSSSVIGPCARPMPKSLEGRDETNVRVRSLPSWPKKAHPRKNLKNKNILLDKHFETEE